MKQGQIRPQKGVTQSRQRKLVLAGNGSMRQTGADETFGMLSRVSFGQAAQMESGGFDAVGAAEGMQQAGA